jgi:ABC-type dipeptide/oligopeptide/nickel transport system permease subunit
LTNAWFDLPNIAVVLVSMGFFGLGVLGLTYGVLSSSWDEETPGSLWGFQEFTTNWGRMTAAWRASRQKN